MKHEIETTEHEREPGFFRSPVILRVAGADRAYGPGGFAIGGWTAEAEARTYHGGPLVRGPHAYVFGLCGVIDTRGGTAREHAEARAEGRLIDVEAGDELVIAGETYRVRIDRRRIPHLDRIDPIATARLVSAVENTEEWDPVLALVVGGATAETLAIELPEIARRLGLADPGVDYVGAALEIHGDATRMWTRISSATRGSAGTE